MAEMRLLGGPRDGDIIKCSCVGDCQCPCFGHGTGSVGTIKDGYIELLMYRKGGNYWVPDRIERQTMVVKSTYPRCDRTMPNGTTNCKNCGAEMDVSSEWSEV